MGEIHGQIIVGADLGGAAMPALELALDLGKRTGRLVHVAHAAAESVVGKLLGTEGTQGVAAVESKLTRLLADVPEPLRGVPHRLHVLHGGPAPALSALAQQEMAGLLIVGPHHKPSPNLFVASTATKLIEQTPCPLFVVKRRMALAGGTFLVPIDMSEESFAALALARNLAEIVGARIRTLHVVEPPAFAYRSGDRDQYAVHEERDRAIAAYEDAVAAFPTGDVELEVEACEGDPGPAIAERAGVGRATIVVMGTRGRGRVGRALVGSVCNHIAVSTPISALITRGSHAPQRDTAVPLA